MLNFKMNKRALTHKSKKIQIILSIVNCFSIKLSSYTAVLPAPQQLMPNSWFLHTQPTSKIVIPIKATKQITMAPMMPAVWPKDPVVPTTGDSPHVMSAKSLLSHVEVKS